MLLKELFINVPEDFATRPLGSGTPSNIPTFDAMYSKIVGTQDAQDVWGSREKKGFEIFGFKDKEEVIGYIIIQDSEVNGAYALRELWVHQDYRRKGLGTGLVLFLLRKIGIKLSINQDEVISQEARDILITCLNKKLIKGISSDGSDPIHALSVLHKTDTSVVISETKSTKPLFGGPMVLDDGRKTFVEHSVLNVLQDSEYN